jgi:uncharacterized GH25 family protein
MSPTRAHRVLRYFVAAAMVSLALASSLDAHDFWVIPDAFTFADGGAISADGHSGTNFPGTPGGAAPANIADARLIGATGEVKIASMIQEGRSLKIQQKPSVSGQYIVALTLQPRVTRATGEGLRKYLAAEGAADEATRLEHDPSFPSSDSLTYRSTKYAATIVEVGRGARAFAKSTGFALEVVPVTDPSRFTTRDTVQFRILAGGKPVSGLRVHAGAAVDSALRTQAGRGGSGGADPDQHVLTDAQGIVRVAVPKSGRWNLRASRVAAPSVAGGAWEVQWTTFVFDVAN